MIDYLGYEDVVALHARVTTELTPDAAPFRPFVDVQEDLLRGLLEAPRGAAHYDRADLVRQAAMLAVDIAQRRPFLRGSNYRTAYTAMLVFLRLNNHFVVPADLTLRDHFERAVGQDDRDAAINVFEAELRKRVRQP